KRICRPMLSLRPLRSGSILGTPSVNPLHSNSPLNGVPEPSGIRQSGSTSTTIRIGNSFRVRRRWIASDPYDFRGKFRPAIASAYPSIDFEDLLGHAVPTEAKDRGATCRPH